MDYMDYYDRVASSDRFDAEWYLQKYPGVRLLNEDPVQNFLEVGLFLNRWPGPHFNPDFYLTTYRDVESYYPPPFIHYLTKGAGQGRPATLVEAKTKIAAATAPLSAVRGEAPIISYCTPVMDRLDDLCATLATNLECHRDLVGEVEFVVALFGNEDGAAEYLSQAHADEINSGLLRIVRLSRLEQWHFGIAKNVFKKLDIGHVYSSLDGDNFVDVEETRSLLKIHEKYGDNFIVHHFSGSWGDGTCGRVSAPKGVYRLIGYDERLLPRQYDEMDMIISTLKRFPALPLICPDPAQSALMISVKTREFISEADICNPIKAGQVMPVRKPMNPKLTSYVGKNTKLKSMSDLNQAICFQKNGPLLESTQKGVRRAQTSRHALIDQSSAEWLIGNVLKAPPRQDVPAISTQDVVLCLCVKDEGIFFPDFLEHYRLRGVTKFLFVDDHSARPLAEDTAGSDVFIFKPKVGTFWTCKTLWIEVLLKAFVPRGTWVLTVDADEFVDLPPATDALQELTMRLEAAGKDFTAGLLIDMLPVSNIDLAAEALNAERLTARFNRVCNQQTACSDEYANHHSVSWGFGEQCAISWRVDARYHAFGTVDSLRKTPLFRYRPGVHLNQGFHDLTQPDGTQVDADVLWSTKFVLLLRHYKLAKWLADWEATGNIEVAGVYHGRTAENLQYIRARGGQEALKALQALPSKPYDCTEFHKNTLGFVPVA